MAKRLIQPSELVARFERELASENINEALKLLPKLAELTPASITSERLHQFYIQALELTKRRDLKQNARVLLIQLESQTGKSAELSRKIGEHWLWLGEENKALETATRSNDEELFRQIKFRAIDRSVIDPVSPSRALLIPAQIEEIQTYHSAYALYETGQYEEARERLNAIGMASPLMEWKLMLRGLIAYTMGEDSKALENWSRLKPDRAPSTMIGPLRACLEPVSMASLTAVQAKKLASQASITQGKLIGNLLKIKANLTEMRQRDPLFDAAKEIVGELKTLSKSSFEKLANAFYWSVSKYGSPFELKPYEQIFGKPQFDPMFQRMRAIVAEKIGEPLTAFQSWGEYERWILRNPQFFPVKFLNQIRGTLQKKIAKLAQSAAADDMPSNSLVEIFGRKAAEKLRSEMTLPSPEPALKAALQLMPEDKEALMMMMDFLLDHQRPKEAAPIVAILDAKHARVPEVLSQLELYHLAFGDVNKVLEFQKRQIELNPLDKSIRERAATLLITFAREGATIGDYAAARKHLDELIASKIDSHQVILNAVMALRGVMDAKEKKTQEWSAIRDQLLTKENRTSAIINLLAEGTRVKLPKKELDGFLAILKEILGDSPNVAVLVEMTYIFSQYEMEPTPYRGMASHRKLIHASLKKSAEAASTHLEVQQLCLVLHTVKSHKLLKEIALIGAGKFSRSPYFWFFVAEAIQDPKNSPMVVRTAQRYYWTAYCRMKECKDLDLKLFHDLWNKRVEITPDLDSMIREFSYG